jgi:glutamine synthetase
VSLTFVATCDLVAITRGRSFPSEDGAARAAAGVGWVPADLALTTFGAIADPNPFGSLGDLRLVPVATARATLPAHDDVPDTDLRLASIVETDGRPWACCPRTALVDAVRDLEQRFGLRVRASFEQEFTLIDPVGEGAAVGAPFSIEAHRSAEPFGSRLVEALAANGLQPENWLPEYGPSQYEITLGPTDAVTAADRAVLTRAIVRDLARATGRRASFSPLIDPDGVGNGVHVHFSFWNADDEPVTMEGSGALAAEAGRFAAGVIAHAPAVVGWTAPSVISSLRLAPHRWSAAAGFVGRQTREAMVRICPTPTLGGSDPLRSANLEFRAADATANPWLTLAAIIRAGIDGLTREMAPAAVVEGEIEALGREERERLGIRELPPDVTEAMLACELDEGAATWFAPELLATHTAVRRTEASLLESVPAAERCARYAAVI